MKRQVIFSQKYPAKHPKKGALTYFVPKIWIGLEKMGLMKYNDDIHQNPELIQLIDMYPMDLDPKYHTIRTGHKYKTGDIVDPQIWQLDGGLYKKGNKKILFAPELEIVKTWDFRLEIRKSSISKILTQKVAYINDKEIVSNQQAVTLAKNDGLELRDFVDWFTGPFDGQILCWNKEIEY